MDLKESRVPLAIFLMGVAVALLGKFLSLSIVMQAGFLCICLAIIALGMEMLVTGRAVFSAWAGQSWGHYERFTGLPARLWGILFLLFGGLAGALTLAGALVPDGAGVVWARFLDTPQGLGLVLFGVGAVATMLGMIRVIAGTALPGSGLGARVSNLLERIYGVLVVLLGLVIVVVGLVLVGAPDLLLAPINQILRSVPTPPSPPMR